MSETLVPPSVSDDDDDVVIALETARVEEERGEPAEAARWVQRAAGAARKQGRPNRAGELSRVQAMLAEAASQFQRATPLEQVLDTDDDFTEHTIVDRPPTHAPAAADARTPAATRNGSSEAPQKPSTANGTARSSSSPAPSTPAPAPTPTSSTPTSSTSSSPAPSSSAPAQRPSSNPGASAAHWATRVAVRKGTGGMLLVRPLRQEEQPSTGEQAALLVPLEPNVRIG